MAGETAEEWRAIPSCEGYEASNLGNIRTNKPINRHAKSRAYRDIKTHPIPKPDGYLTFGPCNNGVPRMALVHRLVLEAFVGYCPDGMEACHYDGNKQNNTIENLRWDTRKANTQDSFRLGAHHFAKFSGENHPTAKLKHVEVAKIREMLSDNRTLVEIAAKFNVSPKSIWNIKMGRTWQKTLTEHKTKIQLAQGD